MAGVFAYSKTKGLFAGVSLEGSAIIERRDANEKLYNRQVKARELLQGAVPVPPAAEPLMRVLNSRVFQGVGGAATADSMYNDVPVYDETHEDVIWQGRTGSAYNEGVRTDRTGASGGDSFGQPARASTWQDELYDQPSPGIGRTGTGRANPSETFDRLNASRGRSNSAYGDQDEYSYSDKPKPGRPTAPKPSFLSQGAQATGRAQPGQAVAKFAFAPDQPGDLGFKKGDIITIVKKTNNAEDWWTGRIGEQEGVFPR